MSVSSSNGHSAGNPQACSPEPLSVAHVILMGVGGISRMILTLIQAQRLNPALRVGMISLQGDGPMSREYESLGTELERCKLNVKSFIDGSVFKLLRVINRYDIVHVHSFHPLLYLITPLIRAKLVYTCHGVGGYGRAPKRFALLRAQMFRHFLSRSAAGLCFVSRFTKDYWAAHGIDNPNSFVIYNATSDPALETSPSTSPELAQALKRTSGKFVVGTSSQFVKSKRNELLIAAFASFCREVDDAVLLLVGDGPEREMLQEQARRLGLENRIVFTGFRHDVRRFQRLFDVAIFPSANETFGLVALEMLQMGKPVICCDDSGGMAEIMTDFPEDIVPASPECLAERLKAFYRNADLRNGAVHVAARTRVAAGYSPANQERNYFAVYRRVTNETNSPHDVSGKM